MDEVRLSPGYDWRISAKKALLDLGKAVLVAAGTAAGMWLSDPSHTAEAVQAAGPYALILTPALIAGGRFLTNWAKNRDK